MAMRSDCLSFDRHIARVERENGKPFHKVVYDFASSGISRSKTAELLGVPLTSFRKWLEQRFTWPAAAQSSFARVYIARVEAEEGKPFLEVLQELAAEGESKTSAAAILDIPQPSFCKWLRDNPQPVEWPARGRSNGALENARNNTPARHAARLRNLGLAAIARKTTDAKKTQ